MQAKKVLMTSNENPAGRLLMLLSAIKQHTQSVANATNSVEEWKHFLRAYTGHSDWDQQRVAQYLMAATEQIVELKKQLNRRDVPSSAYGHSLSIAMASVSTAAFSERWDHIKSRIDTMTIVSLTWANVLLAKVESEISPDEIDAMLERVNELEGLIADRDVPDELREAVVNHIYSIKTALQNYSVGGISKLKEALQQSLGALAVDRHALTDAVESGDGKQKTVVTRLCEILNRTTDIVEKATGSVNSFAALGQAIGNVFKLISE